MRLDPGASARAAGQDLPELDDVLLEVVTRKRSIDAPIVSSPRVGCSPSRSRSAGDRPVQRTTGRGHEPGVDRVESQPAACRAVRLDPVEPVRSVATRPNGTGVAGIAGDGRPRAAPSSRGASRSRGRGPPAGPTRPRARAPASLSGHGSPWTSGPRRSRSAAPASRSRRREIVHAPQSGTSGVAWAARPSRLRAGSPFRGRTAAGTGRRAPPRTAGDRPHDRHARPGRRQPGRRPSSTRTPTTRPRTSCP